MVVPTTARYFLPARHSHLPATLLVLAVPTAAFIPTTTLPRIRYVAIVGRVAGNVADAGGIAAIRRIGRGGSRGVGDND